MPKSLEDVSERDSWVYDFHVLCAPRFWCFLVLSPSYFYTLQAALAMSVLDIGRIVRTAKLGKGLQYILTDAFLPFL